MSLITVRALRPANSSSKDEESKREFQVPVEDSMPVSDLYDIIFSLTDIPPDQLSLKFANKHYTLAEFSEPREGDAKTIADVGISTPSVVEFSTIEEARVEDGPSPCDEEESKREEDSEQDQDGNDNTPGKASEEKRTVAVLSKETDSEKHGNDDTSKDEPSNSTSTAQVQTANIEIKAKTALANIDMQRLNANLGVVLSRLVNPASTHVRQELTSFSKRLEVYHKQALEFDNPKKQATAKSVMPSGDDLERRKTEMRAEAGNEKLSESLLLTKVMLRWFKREFFKWIDKPACWSCQADPKYVNLVQVGVPTRSEIQNGAATRVEVYGCQQCGAMIRFPRYEDPAYLLSVSRKGRCGEWAKAFTMCLVALGLDARMVHDWTDHVWAEVWCEDTRRWVHADSCEESLDQPLLYEEGWGKKLTYCIATHKHMLIDVTGRYSNALDAVRERRSAHLEVPLADFMTRWNARLANAIGEPEVKARVQMQWKWDVLDRERMTERHRKKSEASSSEEAEEEKEELGGRQSGSASWVKARGEDGSNAESR